MKIVIENIQFGYDEGCRLLKLKYEKCPFPALEDFWDDIKPMSFREIAEIENIEKRRVGVLCLGLERLIKEVNPTLVDSTTIKKSTTFVDSKGEVVTKKFNDTYELYKVDGANFGTDRWDRNPDDCYFVKFKDTSTDRVYLCWVDPTSVLRANSNESWVSFENPSQINAIQCIAWTFTTNVPKGNIEKMVRQGDCILIKPKNKRVKPLDRPRHLTEEEYRTLLVAES